MIFQFLQLMRNIIYSKVIVTGFKNNKCRLPAPRASLAGGCCGASGYEAMEQINRIEISSVY